MKPLGRASLLLVLASDLCTRSLAAEPARAHQEAAATKSGPTYTDVEFRADRKKVNKALASSTELVSKHDFDAAIGTLDEALKEVRPASLQATLWLTRANVHQVQGRLSSSQEDLEAAQSLLAGIDEATRRRERSAQLSCYLCSQRSKLYLEWGLIDLAFDWVSRAKALLPVRIATEPGVENADVDPKHAPDFDRERILANYVEALVLSSMEDYPALESSVAAAIQDEVYAKFPGQKSRLLARLGIALKESARLHPADAERAHVILESALADPQFQGFDRILPELALAELALRASDWPTADQRIASAAQSMGPVEGHAALPAHAAWLALSARVLVERRDSSATKEALEQMRHHLERALEQRIEEWGRRDLRPGGYGHLQYGDQQSLVSELMRLDLILEDTGAGDELALSRLLSAGATGTLARRLAAPAVSLSEVRAQLIGGRKEHAHLIYFPAPDRTHLFVVDHASTKHFALPAGDFVEAARYEAERSLRLPVQQSARERQVRERETALAALGRTLLPEDVRAQLKGRTCWTIVGEDLLGPVPFEALDHDGAYLGTTHAITRLPSLAVGVRLVERARREARTAAGTSEVVMLMLSAPLGGRRALADAELGEVIAAYPSFASQLASGPQASLATLQQALPSVRVAQVLAHGLYDEHRERPAGMLLASPEGARESFVGAEEVERLDAPPLVVLTVCGAARAPRRRGDASAADLAGAFLSAGGRARCVVQSSYDLDVESARWLSIHFHAALVVGDAPAEAMRKARAALAGDPDFADPFHHALIGVVGLGHEPIFSR